MASTQSGPFPHRACPGHAWTADMPTSTNSCQCPKLTAASGLGAFKCVMLCGYFEEKYLSWHNPLIQNGRRNNHLEKRNNEISLYTYDGMNILVGATVQGAVVGGGGGGQLS